MRGIENSGIREGSVLGRGSDSVRGNIIQGISDTKLDTDIGQGRVQAAGDFLSGQGASKASELNSLESKNFSAKEGC
ncbi:Uncharacterised protein [Yersinia pseudotuberculosis]|nr:Uncharacterised protein [Yersinia similis]CNL68494.1 Uncharacterised protein [Yersinia pseudotuberculosis]